MQELLSSLWQFSASEPGPILTILGGVHGNEKPGVQIVQNLLQRNLDLLITRGRLNLGIGNPAAVVAGERFVPNDFDLNRSFGDMPKKFRSSVAATRAAELKPILAATNVLIDLHSTLKPSEPMILSPNEADHEVLQKLLPIFAIKKVITGKALGVSSTGVTTDAFVWKNGGLGIAVETGWLEDVNTVPRFEEAVLQAIAALDLTSEPSKSEADFEPELYEAYWSVPASDKFEFTSTWPNFGFLPKDTHFATDNDKKLITSQSSYMVFQKDPERIIPGVEACLLLRKV